MRGTPLPPPAPQPTQIPAPPGQRQTRFQRRNNRLELWLAMTVGAMAMIVFYVVR